MPPQTEFTVHKKSISEKYPSLHEVYATADGLKLYFEKLGDFFVQNMFFNGWKSYHYIINVLVFISAEHIIAAIFNAPDCMHDSYMPEWWSIFKNGEAL